MTVGDVFLDQVPGVHVSFDSQWCEMVDTMSVRRLTHLPVFGTHELLEESV